MVNHELHEFHELRGFRVDGIITAGFGSSTKFD